MEKMCHFHMEGNETEEAVEKIYSSYQMAWYIAKMMMPLKHVIRAMI